MGCSLRCRDGRDGGYWNQPWQSVGNLCAKQGQLCVHSVAWLVGNDTHVFCCSPPTSRRLAKRPPANPELELVVEQIACDGNIEQPRLYVKLYPLPRPLPLLSPPPPPGRKAFHVLNWVPLGGGLERI